MKKRILIANDASYLGTGYGVYGKELLTRLHNTEKYDIAEISCYASIDDKKKLEAFPWKTYPNAPSLSDESGLKSYNSNTANSFGAFAFPYVCSNFKPDIVFDMRDYWMFAYQEISMLRPYFKWVVMPTVDSAPQKDEWLHTFASMDLVVPYTEWARTTLQKQCGSSINLHPDIVNAGVDLEVFVPPVDKKAIKKELFQNENIEITGCVMRNQKRKLLPSILKAYRKYLDRLLEEGKTEQYKNSYLYFHTSYPEQMGWDIPSLLIENRMADKTYFSTQCGKCRKVSATKFHEKVGYCSHCNLLSCMLPGAGNSVTTDSLVKVYQTFDFFLQVAICEGFGMPQVEAAACGVPIASTDYSAMTEIIRNLEGYPITVSALPREMETGADRAAVDNESITNTIYNYFMLPQEERNRKSERTRELCAKYYSWDNVARVWDEALSSVDISTNIPWDSPPRLPDMAQRVPANLGPVEVVKFIIDNIIKEPFLWKTAPLRGLVKDLTNGYALKNKVPSKVDMKIIITQLEGLAKQKAEIDKIRINNV